MKVYKWVIIFLLLIIFILSSLIALFLFGNYERKFYGDIENKAVNSADPAMCFSTSIFFSDPGEAVACLLKVAVAKKDIGVCEEMETIKEPGEIDILASKNDCYAKVITELRNPELCDKIITSPSSKRRCLIGVAILTNDTSVCNNFEVSEKGIGHFSVDCINSFYDPQIREYYGACS